MLVIVDECTRECLAIEVARFLRSEHVLECLGELFLHRGTPSYIRSDNGPELRAHAVREWLEKVGIDTLFIEPGSPWENGTVESFNGKLRGALLNGELFYPLREAQSSSSGGGGSPTPSGLTARRAPALRPPSRCSGARRTMRTCWLD